MDVTKIIAKSITNKSSVNIQVKVHFISIINIIRSLKAMPSALPIRHVKVVNISTLNKIKNVLRSVEPCASLVDFLLNFSQKSVQ